jgi:CRISPR/Cas system-associated endoribonuclease Cas2
VLVVVVYDVSFPSARRDDERMDFAFNSNRTAYVSW